METRIKIESVGHNLGINSGHVLMAPGEDVLILPEEFSESYPVIWLQEGTDVDKQIGSL